METLMSNPLIAPSVMFLLSLLGAYVLFKVLKSAAVIKNKSYQAGGALAGFLLIYGTLTMYHYKLTELNIDELKERQQQTESKVEELEERNEELEKEILDTTKEEWTIEGNVKRADKIENRNAGIEVVVAPFSREETFPYGSYKFRRVKLSPTDVKKLRLLISYDDYIPRDEDVEKYSKIHWEERLIEVGPVVLNPFPKDDEPIAVAEILDDRPESQAGGDPSAGGGGEPAQGGGEPAGFENNPQIENR